jgi:LytR cell envelope-related transcriptional attenuator
VLSDLTKINSLLSVAKQYVITDSGWNLLDFATQMRGLNSGNLSFHTLPIDGYETIAGQDANRVNVPYIQQLVHQTFYPVPRAPASSRPQPSRTPSVSPAVAAKTTVDVFNGGSTPGLAGQVSAALVKDGFMAGQVANTSALTSTQVLYGTGSAASAGKIASLFGVTATASVNVAAGHVQVMLGSGATVPAATPTPSGSAVSLPTSGAQGGAVTAKNGIPCVD